MMLRRSSSPPATWTAIPAWAGPIRAPISSRCLRTWRSANWPRCSNGSTASGSIASTTPSTILAARSAPGWPPDGQIFQDQGFAGEAFHARAGLPAAHRKDSPGRTVCNLRNGPDSQRRHAARSDRQRRDALPRADVEGGRLRGRLCDIGPAGRPGRRGLGAGAGRTAGRAGAIPPAAGLPARWCGRRRRSRSPGAHRLGRTLWSWWSTIRHPGSPGPSQAGDLAPTLERRMPRRSNGGRAGLGPRAPAGLGPLRSTGAARSDLCRHIDLPGWADPG